MNKTILVVDDEVLIAKMIAEVLSDEGYVVQVAFDWLSGLQTLTSTNEDFGLVICDYRLPGGTGLELLQELKKKKGHAPSFLFITGLMDFPQGDAPEIIGSLTKPLDLDHLIQLIHTYFIGHQPVGLQNSPQIAIGKKI
ncbi:MAG: response regulator [Pseudomonadota bacterium]